jgi:hypothetical protein
MKPDGTTENDGEAIAVALAFGEGWSEENQVEMEIAERKIRRVSRWFSEVSIDAACVELVRQGKIGISVDDRTDELVFHAKD